MLGLSVSMEHVSGVRDVLEGVIEVGAQGTIRLCRELLLELVDVPCSHVAGAVDVVRNISEGASRWRPAEKVLKFEIASGEAGEAVGAVVSLVDGGLGDRRLAARFQYLEGRVAAMLTGLIKRHRR